MTDSTTTPVDVPPEGPWTRHGHPIEGVTVDGPGRPQSRARCGGPGACSQCSQDARAAKAGRKSSDGPGADLEVVIYQRMLEKDRMPVVIVELARYIDSAKPDRWTVRPAVDASTPRLSQRVIRATESEAMVAAHELGKAVLAHTAAVTQAGSELEQAVRQLAQDNPGRSELEL